MLVGERRITPYSCSHFACDRVYGTNAISPARYMRLHRMAQIAMRSVVECLAVQGGERQLKLFLLVRGGRTRYLLSSSSRTGLNICMQSLWQECGLNTPPRSSNTCPQITSTRCRTALEAPWHSHLKAISAAAGTQMLSKS